MHNVSLTLCADFEKNVLGSDSIHQEYCLLLRVKNCWSASHEIAPTSMKMRCAFNALMLRYCYLLADRLGQVPKHCKNILEHYK